MVDSIYLHQLAERLGMPVAEMCSRMSAHELTVEWPQYDAYLNRQAQKAQDEQKERSRRV